MLSLMVLFSVVCFTVAGSQNNRARKYEDFFYYTEYNGSRVTWMMMPEDNGLVISAIMGGIKPRKYPRLEDVRLLLWTRGNSKAPESTSVEELKFKNYDPQRENIVLIHGFTDPKRHSNFFRTLAKAFLVNGDYNIIGVDWSHFAAIPWFGEALNNTYVVALEVARAIQTLRTREGAAKPFLLVGYNLGAIVAGIVGNQITIERIMGLDPPYILTTDRPAELMLSQTSASVVEVLHTSGNYIGTNKAIGDRDFYPNGGKWPQPGCTYDLADRCSPRRAIMYYAEALEGGFVFTKCRNYEMYKRGYCKNTNITLWNSEPASINGRFFATTSGEKPFWPVHKKNDFYDFGDY